MQIQSPYNFKLKDIKEFKDLPDKGYQRNSGFIFNITESNSSYNNSNRQNINDTKDLLNDKYIKLGGTTTLNKGTNYFKKINNLYENNFTYKHLNSNNRADSKARKIPTDKNYRNTVVTNKIDIVSNKRRMQRSFNNNYNLNYTNNINRSTINKSCNKDRIKERSLNKDYKYTKMISPNLDNINSNNISFNDLIINKPYNINNNNKSIDLQIYDYIKRNSEDNEKDINKKIKYQNISKMNNNKSMDSKRLLNNNINNKNINSNIIHINNGKIINLSNLANFTYATEKYDCYYENKRDKREKRDKRITPKSNTNIIKKNNKNRNINIKTNTINYINSRKGTTIEEDYTNTNTNTNKNLNKSGNINPILFSKKYAKKENNKYPLRINYTDENLCTALESESLLIFEDRTNDNNYSTKRNTKIMSSGGSNIKPENKKIYEFSKKNSKNNNDITNLNINKKKHYRNERNNTNDNIRNKSLNKLNRNIIQKNYNLFFSGGDKDTNKEEKKNIRKEFNVSNNISKKYSFSTNHDSLSFNPIKTDKNNNSNLEIKKNERLMILKNGNHNKINSMNENNFVDEKRDKVYKISSHVVDEQFYKDNFSEKELSSSDDEDILRMSIQSLNDSKIMEIANRYITDEENLDKNEVIEILNCKKEKN